MAASFTRLRRAGADDEARGGGADLRPTSDGCNIAVMNNNDTASRFPLRIVRGTTGTVHAARELRGERVIAGKTYPAVITKACGSDNRTAGARNGRLVASDAEVTCARCLKALAR